MALGPADPANRRLLGGRIPLKPVSDDVLRILANASWLSAAQVGFGVLAFVSTTYLARTLGPFGFGQWQFAASAGSLLATTSAFGLTTYGAWVVARHRAAPRELISRILSLRIAAIAAVLVGWTGLVLVAPSAASPPLLLIGAAAGYGIRGLWPDWLYQGLARGRRLAAATIAHPALWLALLVVSVRGPDQISAVPATQVISAVALGLAFWIDAWRRLPTTSVGQASRWQILRSAVPLGIAGTTIQLLLSLDYLVLTALSSPAETAQYAAAARVMLFLQGFGVAFHVAVLPAMVQAVQEGRARRLTRDLQTLLLATTVPLAVLLWLFAGPLVVTIYGAPYTHAATVLGVLAWQIPIELVGTIYANLLIAKGWHRWYAGVFMLGAGLKLLLLVVLIPIGAAVAVAFVSLFTVGSIVTVALVLSRHEVEFDPSVVTAVAVGAVCLALFLHLTDLPLLIAIALGLVIYVSTSVLVRSVLAATRPGG
jgi:O-antigen/teichoic acid export membrane protein